MGVIGPIAKLGIIEHIANNLFLIYFRSKHPMDEVKH